MGFVQEFLKNLCLNPMEGVTETNFCLKNINIKVYIFKYGI